MFASRYVQICGRQETYRMIYHAAIACRLDVLGREEVEVSRRPSGRALDRSINISLYSKMLGRAG